MILMKINERYAMPKCSVAESEEHRIVINQKLFL